MYKKSIWDFWAPRYEKLWSQHFALGPSRKLIHKHIIESNLKPTRILDIGCGVGQLSFELAKRWSDATVVGIDTSPAMVKKAQSQYALKNIEYQLTSLEELKHIDPFDIIVSTNAFPYFPDKKRALLTMETLCKENGRVLLLQACNQNYYDTLWLIFVKLTVSKATYYRKETVRDMLIEAGFIGRIVKNIDTAFFIPSVYLIEGIKS